MALNEMLGDRESFVELGGRGGGGVKGGLCRDRDKV